MFGRIFRGKAFSINCLTSVLLCTEIGFTQAYNSFFSYSTLMSIFILNVLLCPTKCMCTNICKESTSMSIAIIIPSSKKLLHSVFEHFFRACRNVILLKLDGST